MFPASSDVTTSRKSSCVAALDWMMDGGLVWWKLRPKGNGPWSRNMTMKTTVHTG
jgi:hypothetical protein